MASGTGTGTGNWVNKVDPDIIQQFGRAAVEQAGAEILTLGYTEDELPRSIDHVAALCETYGKKRLAEGLELWHKGARVDENIANRYAHAPATRARRNFAREALPEIPQDIIREFGEDAVLDEIVWVLNHDGVIAWAPRMVIKLAKLARGYGKKTLAEAHALSDRGMPIKEPEPKPTSTATSQGVKVGSRVTIARGHNSVRGRTGVVTAITGAKAQVKMDHGSGRSIDVPLNSLGSAD
jgi:hypothetical protein